MVRIVHGVNYRCWSARAEVGWVRDESRPILQLVGVTLRRLYTFR